MSVHHNVTRRRGRVLATCTILEWSLINCTGLYFVLVRTVLSIQDAVTRITAYCFVYVQKITALTYTFISVLVNLLVICNIKISDRLNVSLILT